MVKLAVVLVLLHGADGAIVHINPQEVTSLRSKRTGEHFAPGVECLVNLADQKFVAVLEDCNQVRKKLEEAK